MVSGKCTVMFVARLGPLISGGVMPLVREGRDSDDLESGMHGSGLTLPVENDEQLWRGGGRRHLSCNSLPLPLSRAPWRTVVEG